MPRSRCSKPPAAASICRSRWTARARPLCCGRTFLSVGLVDQARAEAERTVAALEPYVERGVPVVGLEPSCILGFRDEIPALLKTEEARWLAARAMLFEEFVTREIDALPPTGGDRRHARCCTAIATRNPSA